MYENATITVDFSGSMTVGGGFSDRVVVLPLPENALELVQGADSSVKLELRAGGFSTTAQPSSKSQSEFDVGTVLTLDAGMALIHQSGLSLEIENLSKPAVEDESDIGAIAAMPPRKDFAGPTAFSVPIGIWGLGLVAVMSLIVIGRVLGSDETLVAEAPTGIQSARYTSSEPSQMPGSMQVNSMSFFAPSIQRLDYPHSEAQGEDLLRTASLNPLSSDAIENAGPKILVPPTNVRQSTIGQQDQNFLDLTMASARYEQKTAAILFLEEKLSDNGMSGINIEGEQGALRARGSHLKSSLPTWQDIQSEYDTAWSAKFPLIVETTAVEPRIPFRVRSVWLGDDPQVITVRGKAFRIGDLTTEMWEVTSITRDAVLLERDGISMTVGVE